jgi:predicted ribosome quality control (RQC) complex YloA/Tae2 family protein
VLKTGKQEPDRRDLIEAARLAARNSNAKHAGIVVVQYCQRKHITKPKGAPPGVVLVHQEQTLTIDLDELT